MEIIVTQERQLGAYWERGWGDARTTDGWKSEPASVPGARQRGGMVPGDTGKGSGSAIWGVAVQT